MKRKNGYAPIGAYAAIGDGRTVALVAADGSIDFLSLPDLHCPTAFGALLDAEKGGRFALAPTARFDSERRYLGRTNVLETTYTTKDGAVRVTEALTLQDGGLVPWTEVARRVEGLAGDVELECIAEPRLDWGRCIPTIERRRGAFVAGGSGLEIGIHCWDAGEPEIADAAVRSRFNVRAGQRALVALTATQGEPIPIPARGAVERRLDATIAVWQRWLDEWEYDGPWPDAVARSALALKLLVHAPNGAIVAAPTTSLPERIGGGKNYDYRYMWVRDASFTIDAFIRLGLPEQVHESFCCLLRAVEESAPELLPFYSVDGRPAERREELPLHGYRGSQPVRYGNAAASQLQLGSWGDLLETASLYVGQGNALDRDTASMLGRCLDRLAVVWADEDSGMWELDAHRHYTSSKLGAWMAFDRALCLVGEAELPRDHAGHWRRERDAVRRFIEDHCWSDEIGAYTEYPGSESLDAAVLRCARMRWPAHSPERFARTVEAIRERLDAGDGLLYRTTHDRDEEGAFLACSFWLVLSLVQVGRVEEAAEVFERLLDVRNDVSLLAEQVDPSSGELLGNFPQGLSHLTLINAACAIRDARAGDASARAGAAAR